jgi:membrane-bound lytic murein transglycosylase A
MVHGPNTRGALALLLLALPAAARGEVKAVPPLAVGAACDDLELASLAAALNQESAILSRRSGPPLEFGAQKVAPRDYAARTLAPLAQLAQAGDRAALCQAVTARFGWYRVSDAPILMTAYHTPSVRGSLQRTDTYRWPLYRRPPDATSFSTAQILAGAFNGRNLELIWLTDPYDALALHVEGGGNILLPDGKLMHIGADGHNGMAYQNVSKLLAADGKLPPGPPPPSSLPGNPKARKYFTEHPAELNVYWGKNPHFVYFKASAHGGGGKLGALTPGRSIAVDPAFVPFGAVMLIRAQKPIVTNGSVSGWQPYMRLVLGQDTGAGIKGPGRIDVYFGEDDYAQIASASTSVNGDAYVLLGR